MELCTDYHFLQALVYVKYFINIGLIVIPVILLVVGSYDCFKVLMSGKAEDAKAKALLFAKRICAVLIIMLLPEFLTTFTKLIGNEWIMKEANLCFDAATKDNVDNLRSLALNNAKNSINSSLQDYTAEYQLQLYENSQGVSSSTASATGSGSFAKYELNEEQLELLALVAINEQGSLEGAAAEASLMANLFELQGGSFGEGAQGLVNYVQQSGWFASASFTRKNEVSDELKRVISAVLVEGKRTLPGYINEHDYNPTPGASGDISSVDGPVPYVAFESVLHNRFGSTYTFYSYPTSGSDPFGYTSEDARTRIGDDCYNFEDL